MRRFSLTAALLLAAACSPQAAADAQQGAGSWQPHPIKNALDPTAVVKTAPDDAWRPVDPNNLLVIELSDGGRVAIQLAPAFAPVHVANIRALGPWRLVERRTIYRVQDNYVAQWGHNDGGATAAGRRRQGAAGRI